MQKVIYHIEQNLFDDLDLEKLARVAGYSKYHFCRVFKLYVGESVVGYITRLRLERSLFKMVGKNSVIDVALEIGYETPNGYNKAFQKAFGMSPTEYKKRKREHLQISSRKLMEMPKLVSRDASYTIFQREIGDYEHSSKKAWEKLSDRLDEMELEFDIWEKLGICHDDPTVTKEENIRYDAAIVLEKQVMEYLADKSFESKKIEGGRYASVMHFGDCSGSLQSWMGLYGWIEQNGYKLRDQPPFEKYVNISSVEIYIPIE